MLCPDNVTLEIPPPWPHQPRAVALLEGAIRAGHRSIVLAAPCGAGKTRIMADISRRAAAKGKRVGIFTNRKLLTRQSRDTLRKHDVDFGVLAADYSADWQAPVQVCSLQTISSRVYSAKTWELPPFDLVFIDEAHSNTGGTASRVIAHYKERHAVIVGPTATPVGLTQKHTVNGALEPLYSTLVIAAVNSELRKCGALVVCDVFAPDEPDMKGVQVGRSGEFVQEEAARRAMETIVFANVFAHWRRLNPFALPTLLFAPGVDESRWFVKEWEAQGVRAAHMDADTDNDERERILEAHRAGEVRVICSCGVLREGADLPWARHGILVQPCNALSTYLQLVGRLLRAHPGKDGAILQDHAGAFHRHGSPNADRHWKLEDTNRSIAARSRKDREAGLEREPICCPRCNGVRAAGPKCPHCGHEHVRSVRTVRMTDGTLTKQTGAVVKQKRQQSEEQKLWTSCLCAAGRSGRTLKQAAGDFHRRAGKPLPGGLQFAPPPESLDWGRKVAEVYAWTVRNRKGA
jgi:DNA repair protein RadD